MERESGCAGCLCFVGITGQWTDGILQMEEEFQRFVAVAEEFNHVFEQKIKTWINGDRSKGEDSEESEALGLAISESTLSQESAVNSLEWIREAKNDLSMALQVDEGEKEYMTGSSTESMIFDLQKKTQILNGTLSRLAEAAISDG